MTESMLIVSPAPHIRARLDTPAVMRDVMLALLPAALAGVYYFRMPALIVLVMSVASAVGTEYVIEALRHRPMTVRDGSAAVTGLLIGLILPPNAGWWIPVFASIFAIGVVKLLFGGLGHNIFNPALAGRIFVGLAWPMLIGTAYFWPGSAMPPVSGFDAMTTATPLTMLKMGEIGAAPLSRFYSGLFLGNVSGCIGETSALALLIGALYLLWKGHITLRIPMAFIGTVVLITGLYGQDPMFHILSGGLILGAFFMATDYVTSPSRPKGQLIFAIGCGLLTAMIRLFGGYPEGVAFSILIMNSVVPMIDRFGKPKRFGEVRSRA